MILLTRNKHQVHGWYNRFTYNYDLKEHNQLAPSSLRKKTSLRLITTRTKSSETATSDLKLTSHTHQNLQIHHINQRGMAFLISLL